MPWNKPTKLLWEDSLQKFTDSVKDNYLATVKTNHPEYFKPPNGGTSPPDSATGSDPNLNPHAGVTGGLSRTGALVGDLTEALRVASLNTIRRNMIREGDRIDSARAQLADYTEGSVLADLRDAAATNRLVIQLLTIMIGDEK